MQDFKTTREVADELGVMETRIENTIRRREIERPPMVGGVRLWSPAAVERLRTIFATRDAHRRRRSARATRTPLLDPVDLAIDLDAELRHEAEQADAVTKVWL